MSTYIIMSWVDTQARTHTHTTHTHTSTCTHTHTCTCTHTLVHIHTKHTHIQVPSQIKSISRNQIHISWQMPSYRVTMATCSCELHKKHGSNFDETNY